MKKQELTIVKPQYKKTDVLEFLSKVRSKAIEAINKEYEARYDTLFNDLIDQNPELNVLIDNSVELVVELGKISDRIAEIVKEHWDKKDSYNSGNFERYKAINLIAEICTYYTDKNGVLKALKKEQSVKLEEVKASYRAVEFNIRGLSSPAKMRAYLDSLGFDTSYLDRIVDSPGVLIDPTKLFPCKERGLLEG